MDFTKNQEDAQRVLGTVYKKCWEDKSFREELIASPEQTLEKFTGNKMNVPQGVKLVVNDQTNPSYIHINIPPKPNYNDMTLTDVQLEAVAGGEGVVAGATLLFTALMAGIMVKQATK